MQENSFSGLIVKPRLGSDYVHGVSSPIPYVVRDEMGDWRPYLSPYFGQKIGGHETSCCWDFAGCADASAQCNFLKTKGQFPAESLKWFQDNGYLDATGCFAFSEDFIAIISGVRNNGNDHMEWWRLTRLNGVLPRADLSFDETRAYQLTHDQFINEFFDPKRITAAMRQKALDSKKYLDLAYEWLGPEFELTSDLKIQACLKQSPVQVGVPACMQTWNSGTVMNCGSNSLDHSVFLTNLRADGTKDFRDTYNPADKTFDPTYPIRMPMRGVVSPILSKPPYVAPATAVAYPDTFWSRFWKEFWSYVSA